MKFKNLHALIVYLLVSHFSYATLPAITATGGRTTICIGTSDSLTDAYSGGTWSVNNPAIAAVGSSTGFVTGVAGGVAVITYTAGGYYTTISITVTYPISGVSTVCMGDLILLNDSTATGWWGSSNAAVAAITVSGQVTGGAVGSATITYGRTGACFASRTITVTGNSVGSITGLVGGVCSGGGTLTAYDTTAGGIWVSSNTTVATINSTTGVITGYSAGGVTITYSKSGCYQTAPLTVNSSSLLAAITGTPVTCLGTNSVLSDATPLGTWNCSNSTITRVNTDGSVTGLLPGVDTITYSRYGCTALKSFTVTPNNLPAITGGNNVCIGNNITLNDSTLTGRWTSSNTSSATVGSATGIVTGVATGSAIITFLNNGCYKTNNVAVAASIVVGGISGANSVCQGASTTWTDSISGGAWSSADITKATITIWGGLTGISAGTVTITYTRLGCYTTKPFTINPLPVISGTMAECANGTTTLYVSPTGGAWTSATHSVATIDPISGIVTGVAPGNTLISYTLPTGCLSSVNDTAYGPVPISGGDSVCAGSLQLYLSDVTSGGSWSTKDTSFATVGLSSGVVTGVAAGTATITYQVPISGLTCYVTTPITVNVAPQAIFGGAALCPGTSATLYDFTPGGTWSSNNSGIATVGSLTGVVTGVSAGSDFITYTKSGCYSTYYIYVTPPLPAIAGSAAVCSGYAHIILTDATSGGAWSTSDSDFSIASSGSDSARVTGISPGTGTVTYTVGGCMTTLVITIGNNTVLPLSGFATVCTGSSTTLSTSGGTGTWTSQDSAVASFSSVTGLSANILGVVAGTAIITYTRSADGCFKDTLFTVYTQPASISGVNNICDLATTLLSDATSGGTWSSQSSSVATIGSTGLVTGIAPGHVAFTYTMPGGCTSYQPMIVNPLPGYIVGATGICLTQGAVLTDSIPGTWSSGNTGVATIGSATGVVTSVSAGTTIITFTATDGCGTQTATVAVEPLPAAITGASNICSGFSTTFSCTTSGGTWSSSNTTIATVGSSTGVVTGVSAGTALISYALPTGCSNAKIITIKGSPGSISGLNIICTGYSSNFTDTPSTGIWTSSNTSAATVGSLTGIVTGVTAANATITYTLPSGCYSTKAVSVNTTPNAVLGSALECTGVSTTYTDATGGGTWSSANTAVTTIVSSTGVATGVALGTAIISYTMPSGCANFITVSVNASPAAIVDVGSICTGTSYTFTDATGGGVWTSSNTSAATVGTGTGIVTGVTAAPATISYTVAGCSSIISLSVNASPYAVSGVSSLCNGYSATYTDATSGGIWVSSNTTVVTAGSISGIITGVSAGATIISYIVSTGCSALKSVTINQAPAAIVGPGVQCTGTTTQLTDATGSGTWTSSNNSAATVGAATGIVTGVTAASLATITYTISSGCYSTQAVSVYATPYSITGGSTLCSGFSETLYDVTTGGTWSSANTVVAAFESSTALVTGVAAGTCVISYTVASGCASSIAFAVNASPAAISGYSSVCTGISYTFTDATTGGTWYTSNASAATVGATTGVVTGVVAAPATISYSAAGCSALYPITVNTSPYAIAGVSSLTVGSSSTFADASGGGTWSSGNPAVATVNSSGKVTGVAAGSDVITYALASGCASYKTISITSSSGRNATLLSSQSQTLGELKLFPNPNPGQFEIKGAVFSPKDGAIFFQVINMPGQVILEDKIKVTNGEADQLITLPGTVPNGVYFLNLFSETGNRMFRVMVEK